MHADVLVSRAEYALVRTFLLTARPDRRPVAPERQNRAAEVNRRWHELRMRMRGKAGAA